MKPKDLAVVCTSALATLLFAAVVLWPYRASAIGPKESEAPLVASPVLRTQGCELSVLPLPGILKAGDAPAVQVKAVNTTGTAVTVRATLSLMLAPPSDPVARALPMPREAWKGECLASLKAHETQTLTLTPNVKLPPGANGYFTLKAAGAAVTALRFAVETPAARPVAAASEKAAK